MKRNPFAQPANDEPITLASETNLPAAAPLNYDYSLISETDRQTVQVAAAQIKLQFKRAQNSILEIGKQLAMVKSKLDHGQWGDWLNAEFSLTDRSAQRYMQAFETFGNKPDANLLTSSALMLLSGDTTPEPAREEAINTAKATGKSPTKTEVKEIITKHKPIIMGEPECYNILKGNTAAFNQIQTRAWLRDHAIPSDIKDLIPPNRQVDNDSFLRARSKLLAEHQSAPMKEFTPPRDIETWLLQRGWEIDTNAERGSLCKHVPIGLHILRYKTRSERKEAMLEAWSEEITAETTQKPAELRSPAPASITPVQSTTPQIARPAPATPSDLPVADQPQPDVKALINHYTESVRLLPIAKQAINNPAFQWSYDRLQKDLRILAQYLNQL